MNERKVFQDSVVSLPDQTGFTAQGLIVNAIQPEQNNEPMSVLFSLAIPEEKQKDLETKVANGEIIPPDVLGKDYGADPKQVDALVDWLKTQDYKIEKISDDGTSIYASATIEAIKKSLEVNMIRVTKDGLTYTAAQNAPSLPEAVSSGVNAILGLQPFRHANKYFRKRSPVNLSKALNNNLKNDAIIETPVDDNLPPYFVHEINKTYNADNLNLSGKGQTIAILIDTFPNEADLESFWKQNNLDTTIDQVEMINVNNAHLIPPEGEETLDTEWTSGIAPGSKIRIYASGTLQFVDLNKCLDQIISDLPAHPEMRQMSISLGLGEIFMGGQQGVVATQHQKFLKLSAAGVNVFVSSGDAGSNPDVSGHSPTGPLQPEYSSSDPNVIAVGGTTLSLNVGGEINDESGWVSSGGGKSTFFPRPTWQKGNGVPVGNERLVPDVSLAADPETGAFLILNGKAIQIGGTSWSAPVWAGFCALINEARANIQKAPLPFLNPLLYALQGTSCFRDILRGSNGAFDAGSGYDLVTGLGVPDLRELIAALTK